MGYLEFPKEGIARETTTTTTNHSRSLDNFPPHKRFFSIYTTFDLKVGHDPPGSYPHKSRILLKALPYLHSPTYQAYDIKRPTMTPPPKYFLLQPNLPFARINAILLLPSLLWDREGFSSLADTRWTKKKGKNYLGQGNCCL